VTGLIGLHNKAGGGQAPPAFLIRERGGVHSICGDVVSNVILYGESVNDT
jgi:hypothetical protein